MSRTVKAVIAGAVIFGVGVVILLVTGLATGFKFDDGGNWEMKSYTCEQQVNTVKLDFSADALEVMFYDGDEIKVEYPERKNITTQCSVHDGTLTVSSEVHFRVRIWWFNKIPTTKIYIPKSMQLNYKIEVDAGALNFGEGGSYGNVSIRLNAGAINMGDVTCGDFRLELNAGAINFSKLVCDKFDSDVSAGALNVKSLQCDDVKLDVSAGSAKLGIVGAKSDYTIHVDKSAGSCNVSSQSGGSKRLRVDISAGSVSINFDK